MEEDWRCYLPTENPFTAKVRIADQDEMIKVDHVLPTYADWFCVADFFQVNGYGVWITRWWEQPTYKIFGRQLNKNHFAVYTQVLGHPKRGDRPDDRFSLNHWKITPAIRRETQAFQTWMFPQIWYSYKDLGAHHGTYPKTCIHFLSLLHHLNSSSQVKKKIDRT